MKVEIQTTVLGGFPVLAQGNVLPPEPDVGVTNSYVEDVCITSTKGRPIPFIEAKMKDGDWADIETQILEAKHDAD